MRDLVRLLIKYWYLVLITMLYPIFFSWLFPDTLPHFIVEIWGIFLAGIVVWGIFEWKGGGVRDEFWLRSKIRYLEPPIRELIGISRDIMEHTSCLSLELLSDLSLDKDINIRREAADKAYKAFGDIKGQPEITHEAYPHLRNSIMVEYEILKMWIYKNDPLVTPLFERYPSFGSAIKELEFSFVLCINLDFRLEGQRVRLNMRMSHMGQSAVKVYKQSLDILEKAGVLSAK